MWTVAKEVSLRYVPVIDTGGQPVYGGLELIARADLDVAGVEVENLASQNPEATKWFPHLKAGFEAYQEMREREGKPLGALRLLITKVYSHETNTHGWFMALMAKEALEAVFAKQNGGLELDN